MKKAWPWIIGIAVGLIVITLLVYVRSDPLAYRFARGGILRPVQLTQESIHFPGHVNFATQTPIPRSLYDWKK